MNYSPEQSRRMKIFIVIPIHNEEEHVLRVLNGVSRYKLPIVVVNDGSTDATRLKIQGVRSKNVKLLDHGINLGKGAALKTGAEYAFGKGADAVIFMDSDGQHKADDLPKFINELKRKQSDVIFGSRNLNFGVPLIRYLGNKLASVIVGILFGIYVSDSICGYRALTRNGYKKLKWDSVGYGVELEMVARAGKLKVKTAEIPVQTVYHDSVKGVTILNGFGILGELIKLKLTI
jgi:glycosyltransferase involved in cell wall biosynthesis